MMVFYTDWFIPARLAACTRGPFIFIRPAYKDDAGLLAHEKVHVKQWLRTLGLHGLLYLLFDKYKLASEVEAYKVQASLYSDDRRPQLAAHLATHYGLNITQHEALKRLKE